MQLYTIHHINVSDVAIAVGVGIGAPCITMCHRRTTLSP